MLPDLLERLPGHLPTPKMVYARRYTVRHLQGGPPRSHQPIRKRPTEHVTHGARAHSARAATSSDGVSAVPSQPGEREGDMLTMQSNQTELGPCLLDVPTAIRSV